jgi:hypothetical protein
VVIIEGDWGRIEEINTTYIVVRMWDERRLIVPLSYFISHPFQNWTQTSADILGTVFIHVAYTMPVKTLREELKRICEVCPLWDRRVCAAGHRRHGAHPSAACPGERSRREPRLGPARARA